jgi:AGZA family xanthine/uracil permease-like MFS transporter
MEEVKRQYVSSTAIASMVACFVMGVMGNLPVALAPGMGMLRMFYYFVDAFLVI